MFKSSHGAWEGTCTLCWAWPQQVQAARMVLYMTLASRLHPLSSSRGMQVSLLINCKNCDALTLILELMVVFIFLSPSLSAYLLSQNVLRSIMRPDFRYIAICAQMALRRCAEKISMANRWITHRQTSAAYSGERSVFRKMDVQVLRGSAAASINPWSPTRRDDESSIPGSLQVLVTSLLLIDKLLISQTHNRLH